MVRVCSTTFAPVFMRLLVAAAAIAVFGHGFALAEIVSVNTILPYGITTLSETEVFSPSDAPATTAPGNGRAYLALELTVTRALSLPAPIARPDGSDSRFSEPSELEVFVLAGAQPPEAYFGMDKVSGGGVDWCAQGRVVQRSAAPAPWRNYLLSIPASQTAATLSVPVPPKSEASDTGAAPTDLPPAPIVKTDQYSVVVAQCGQAQFPPATAGGKAATGVAAGAKETPVFTVKGFVVWMNPYGYLPGQLYPFLPFYGILAVAYLSVALVWVVLMAIYNKELITLQRLITVILALCVLEAVLCCGEYYMYNMRGVPVTPLLVLCALVRTAHQTGSRLLVVAVSVGYGVLRPSLGTAKTKLISVGATYFVLTAARELLTRLDLDAVATHAAAVLALDLGAFLIDCLFVWWTMISLYDAIAYLRAHKQGAKLWLLGRFALVLSLAVAAQVVFILYHVSASVSPSYRWKRAWLTSVGFSQILYFVVLLATVCLWRPSKTSRRYEYSQVADGGVILADQEDIELDAIAGHNDGAGAAAGASAGAGGHATASIQTASGRSVMAAVESAIADIDITTPPQFTVDGAEEDYDVSATDV